MRAGKELGCRGGGRSADYPRCWRRWPREPPRDAAATRRQGFAHLRIDAAHRLAGGPEQRRHFPDRTRWSSRASWCRVRREPAPARAVTARAGPACRRLRQLQGKELSWNNLLDADAARKLVAQCAQPTVVIVKHNNPCGVGRGPDLATAYGRALAADPISAFGSIVALNRPADRDFAAAAAELFIEV